MTEIILKTILYTVAGAGVGFVFGVCVFGFLAACKTLWVMVSKKIRHSPLKTTHPAFRPNQSLPHHRRSR